jgi:hypothetical protein
MKWHPFIFHAQGTPAGTYGQYGAWSFVYVVLSGLFRDIGLFLPIGIVAFLTAVVIRRLDRRVFVPSLLFVSLFTLFVIARKWGYWYIVDFLPSFAVVAAHSLAKVYELSHKILRICIVGGIIGILVINSLAATSFVAAFTSNNSWKSVGGVAQGFAEKNGCPIVYTSQDGEALWYFRDQKFHNLGWVMEVRPNRFIMVSTQVYLGQIKAYIASSGLIYHEVTLWQSPTFVEIWHPPTDLDVLKIWLFTADAGLGVYPPLTRMC